MKVGHKSRNLVNVGEGFSTDRTSRIRVTLWSNFRTITKTLRISQNLEKL